MNTMMNAVKVIQNRMIDGHLDANVSLNDAIEYAPFDILELAGVDAPEYIDTTDAEAIAFVKQMLVD